MKKKTLPLLALLLCKLAVLRKSKDTLKPYILPTGIGLDGKTLPKKAKTMATVGNNRQIIDVKR